MEAEEGKVSPRKALALQSFPQARDQPAVALLRLRLDGLCETALLPLCPQPAECPVSSLGDTRNTLAQQALRLMPVFGGMKCWERPAGAREVSSQAKVAQKRTHPSEQGWDRLRVLKAGKCCDSFE